MVIWVGKNMFDHTSLRFLINLILGNIVFFLWLAALNESFGTVRPKYVINPEKKGKTLLAHSSLLIMTGALLISVFWLFRTFQREMDLPGILSSNYVSVEGTVEKYIHDSGGLVGGRLSIEGVDGKSYRFIDIDIPSYLEKRDWVKVDYRKYSRVGAIVEINGAEHGKLTDYYFELTLFFIVFLLLAMPFYSFHIFKWKPLFNWKEDYSIFVYQDLFTQAICVVQIIMLQGAAVLGIALLGKYSRFLDWYWGGLICANYLGLLLLSLFRQKRFVLIKDKFYYCNFIRRMEGSLGEIEHVKRVDKGILIHVRGEELEILCTKEKYVDTLMKKLGR
ncbi:MAG: hypothetical protein MR383_08605 [Lachnospiraceae bacterium]|nr:hypothetical protein [Lachnospiraceae bacterium]